MSARWLRMIPHLIKIKKKSLNIKDALVCQALKRDFCKRFNVPLTDLDASLNNFTLELLEKDLTESDNDGTFDVAKWSRLDIQCIMDNIDIKYNEKELDNFIDSVIARLSDEFDASRGITWDIIEDAVYSEGEVYDWLG